MEERNFRKEVIDLCDDSMRFWDNLKREMDNADGQEAIEVARRWKEFFQKNHMYAVKFAEVKLHSDRILAGE